MPAIVTTIIGMIPAIIKAAPDVVKAYELIRAFVEGLFGNKVITKVQQDYIMAMVDAYVAAFKAGEIPPAWTVEPDPE